jgi:hypothetical protein
MSVPALLKTQAAGITGTLGAIINTPWATVSGSPTTLSGYGISNGQVALTLTTTGTATQSEHGRSGAE